MVNITREADPTVRLDQSDLDIIAELSRNARLSNKELAAKIGLAPSTCLLRVRKLTEHRVLRGFHAEVDPKSVGVGLQAMISIRLREHAEPGFKRFFDYLLTIQEIVAIYHLAGKEDLLLHVAVRDSNHLRDFVVGSLAIRSEVGHLETYLVFDSIRTGSLPQYR